MDNKLKEKKEADCPRCGWIEPWDNEGIMSCDCVSEPVVKNGKKPLDELVNRMALKHAMIRNR